MNSNKTIIDIVESNYDEVVSIRKHLHKYPELSEKEYETSKYIQNFLNKLGVKYKKVADTGLFAFIENGCGKKLAFRADMDALPIDEKTNVDFKSVNKDVMHACGHDIHMSVQLGVIKCLVENKHLWKGEARFFFQPAEETVGGAKRMLDEGVNLDKADAIFGLHCAPEIEAGSIGIKHGKLHATSAVFKMKIIGKSSHAALAYQGIDSIVIGSKVVDYLQTIVSRKIDARDCAVITVGTFNGGFAENVVAENVELTGTIRTLTKETKKYIVDILKSELVKFVESYGAKIEINIRDSYAPVINNNEMTDFLSKNARDILGKDKVIEIEETRMDVEDMGFFLEQIPGSFYRLGVGTPNETYHELHSNKFIANELSLRIGMLVQLKNALEFLCIE
ncbi:M20 metallopeptidase family protein [Caviibacter abscessus]|uniref:M20 metallopeptidase family protein n=1 Tax=Caviibacter abscessus TaxID=1766719 RepID=UPI00083148BB|nr:amidohydrolase [Caviibacter abscessus]